MTIRFFLIISFILLTSCSKHLPQPSSAKPVHIGTAITQSVPIYIESFGYLKAPNDVNIISQQTGKILECHFKQGQEVKKEDLLFTIDPQLYQAQLNINKATLKRDKADMQNKQFIVDRDKKLVATGAISEQDFVLYCTNLAQAKASVELDKASIQQSQINLGYCYIKSPIDGVVGQRQIDPGNVVVANNGPVLVNVKTIDPLYVDFTIPEKNLFILKDAVAKGQLKVVIKVQEFGVKASGLSGVSIGDLMFFDNSVNNQTGTIFLRAIVANKDKKLWPGQFVKVYLILSIQENAMLVPIQAVNQGMKGDYLFTIHNNKARVHYIAPGLKEADYIIINDDNGAIKAGDRVVTVGQMGLVPDVEVKIVGEDNFDLPPNPDYYKELQGGKKTHVITSSESVPVSTLSNPASITNQEDNNTKK